MAILLRKISARHAYSFYKVPYGMVLNVTTALKSIQEQRFTPLVENDNQQQIYGWVRNYLLLPPGRGDYKDWELCQSVEGGILLKSSCTMIHDDFGVLKTSIYSYLNLMFPPLKCSSLKHLWYLTSLGDISNTTVRKLTREKNPKKIRTWILPSQGQKTLAPIKLHTTSTNNPMVILQAKGSTWQTSRKILLWEVACDTVRKRTFPPLQEMKR